jgi:hypothetical protein
MTASEVSAFTPALRERRHDTAIASGTAFDPVVPEARKPSRAAAICRRRSAVPIIGFLLPLPSGPPIVPPDTVTGKTRTGEFVT